MMDIEQRAYVLHSRPYRENQLLVDLLTEYDGKVGAVVYSGKSAKSSKKSILQPFQPIKVKLKGRSSLKKLSLLESDGRSLKLQGNYLFSAFYVNELLVRLLPELVPCEPLYQAYLKTLQHLVSNEGIEPSLRYFEMTLLQELGIALDFEPAYQLDLPFLRFCPELGLVSTDKKQGNYDKLHVQAIAEQSVNSPEVLLTFKRLMRQIIEQLLGNKPLNSRKLFIK